MIRRRRWVVKDSMKLLDLPEVGDVIRRVEGDWKIGRSEDRIELGQCKVFLRAQNA